MKFKHNLEGRRTFNYIEYRNLIEGLLEKGKTTGENHSASFIQYTEMNEVRMNRHDKRGNITEELAKKLESLQPQKWVVIVEAWCGDAAQNLPWFYKMAKLNANIDLQIILRDENLDIMEDFLTNGGRSIPKMFAFDSENNLLFEWGPRPKKIQQYFLSLREQGMDHETISKELHTLYARDKGLAIQNDLLELLETQELVAS